MINISKVENFSRNTWQLEEFILFCAVVAGKKSKIQAQKLDAFLKPARLAGVSPFGFIRILLHQGTLRSVLEKVKIGQYDVLIRTCKYLVRSSVDLKKASVEELEAIPGVGPKTARFFVLYTRKDVEVAILDTHILAWLRKLGYKAPKQTPSSQKQYKKWEDIFISECRRRKRHPRNMDKLIWAKRAIK